MDGVIKKKDVWSILANALSSYVIPLDYFHLSLEGIILKKDVF